MIMKTHTEIIKSLIMVIMMNNNDNNDDNEDTIIIIIILWLKNFGAENNPRVEKE